MCAYFCMVVSALLKSKCLLLMSSLLALLFTLAVMGMLVTWVSLLIIGRALDFPLPSLVIGIVVAIYAGFFLCEGVLNGLPSTTATCSSSQCEAIPTYPRVVCKDVGVVELADPLGGAGLKLLHGAVARAGLVIPPAKDSETRNGLLRICQRRTLLFLLPLDVGRAGRVDHLELALELGRVADHQRPVHGQVVLEQGLHGHDAGHNRDVETPLHAPVLIFCDAFVLPGVVVRAAIHKKDKRFYTTHIYCTESEKRA